jgi:hypothetical protein
MVLDEKIAFADLSRRHPDSLRDMSRQTEIKITQMHIRLIFLPGSFVLHYGHALEKRRPGFLSRRFAGADSLATRRMRGSRSSSAELTLPVLQAKTAR